MFISPESRSHEKSYGERFADALMDAKKIFYYLYLEDKVRNQEQLEVLKKIVLSTMLRNELFLAPNGQRLVTLEPGISTFYDKKKNKIKNIIDDKKGDYYEIEFDETIEGKKAFLNNFYSVKNYSKQQGMKPRTLTREQRNKEVYNFLYPSSSNVEIKK